jgi:excisionase family DNA binding protein
VAKVKERTEEKTALLDLHGAAARLGVHIDTARRRVRDGSLPASLIGGVYRIKPEDLERYIEESQGKDPTREDAGVQVVQPKGFDGRPAGLSDDDRVSVVYGELVRELRTLANMPKRNKSAAAATARQIANRLIGLTR